MRPIVVLAVLFSVFPSAGLAAPPANDNRADAAAIPSFPSTLTATTAEATVERLDPQVSRCGRVDATVWYRIDTAPDGLVSLTIAGSPGTAPVLRIYRRARSSIQEIDCAAPAPGQSASATFEAVRGNNYLVLVGRRPGSPDGTFDLKAELFLPPANDNRGGALALRLPGAVAGSTLGATSDEFDPGCGIGGGTVWYRMTGGRGGRALLRLTARGELDAAVAVLERVRSQLRRVACAQTNRQGGGSATFTVRRGGTYFIAVGHRDGSDPGTFRLESLLSEAAESRRAGKQLPRAGVGTTLHGLTDINDVWRISMQPGTTYRLGFSSEPCASVSLRARRSLDRPLALLDCRGFTTFTPGPDGAGDYVLEVVAGGEARTQSYRLRFAPAAPDDLGVGVLLRNRATTRGSLDPSRLDVRDLYHFDLDRRADIRLSVTGGLTFQLLRDDGRRLGIQSVLRRQLGPGRYVVAVTAPVGEPAARYALSLLIREITSTTLQVSATTVPPRAPVLFSPQVAQATSGTVEIQIDRFDPLTGWHFNRLLRVPVGGSVGWSPPAEGRWRARASFQGTTEASPSRSGYVHLLVERRL